MDEYEDMRSMMDYVDSTEQSDDIDAELLTFVDNSIFMESQAHHWHLQCNYYSKHMELDEFYEDLPELVDTFVEGLMNTRGPLPIGMDAQYTFVPLENAISTLEVYVEQARQIHRLLDEREDFGSVNSLEDIISFVEATLYKLKHLQ
ncbi:hypothetical protein BZF66_06665 [Salmonella enterica]|uniref:DUF5856 family protein n=1 Tax=Salmonella enterica TaxID=28901 RepID=UPI00137FA180|nr:hypothetical protein [Salmonella enterica]ECV9084113.1 hypothetical protein [Salmonella enterica subsp. enterica serovar Infantis]EHX8550429.1 hypothetical protein [Salmonella enterica]EME3783148.1 hypothetical protein [Salmonella enterica]